jgi:hypothetical protein
VAGIKRDAGILQRRRAAYELRERNRFLHRRDTDPMHAEIELDVDRNWPPDRCGRCREMLDRDRRVESNGDSGATGDGHDATCACCTDRRICEQHVVADVAHHFGFARSRAREPDRAATHLLLRDPRRFVCLDVRSEREAVLGSVCSCTVEVALHPVEIDDRCWGFQLVEGHGLGRVSV